MVSKGTLKVLARLTALEYLVEHMLLMIAKSQGDPAAVLRSYAARVEDELATATMTGFDPAMSDLLIQEMTDQVRARLQRVLSHLDSPPGA